MRKNYSKYASTDLKTNKFAKWPRYKSKSNTTNKIFLTMFRSIPKGYFDILATAKLNWA
jgi:hypothetical protein